MEWRGRSDRRTVVTTPEGGAARGRGRRRAGVAVCLRRGTVRARRVHWLLHTAPRFSPAT